MFPISSCQISLCKMYSIGIVSDCMSRKIIRSTPDRNNLFGRKMKSSLNYLFIRLTDVIVRNKHRELQLLLKLENGDVRCNQYIAWLLEIYQSSFLKKMFVLYFTKMLLYARVSGILEKMETRTYPSAKECNALLLLVVWCLRWTKHKKQTDRHNR